MHGSVKEIDWQAVRRHENGCIGKCMYCGHFGAVGSELAEYRNGVQCCSPRACRERCRDLIAVLRRMKRSIDGGEKENA